jgi:hypothetical protein
MVKSYSTWRGEPHLLTYNVGWHERNPFFFADPMLTSCRGEMYGLLAPKSLLQIGRQGNMFGANAKSGSMVCLHLKVYCRLADKGTCLVQMLSCDMLPSRTKLCKPIDDDILVQSEGGTYWKIWQFLSGYKEITQHYPCPKNSCPKVSEIVLAGDKCQWLRNMHPWMVELSWRNVWFACT